jgi:N-acetylglutamate synthase-like GNAT family acetyltransferase
MMNQLKLKVGQADDVKEIVDWLNANQTNGLDPDILKYPTLRIVTAYNGRNIAHMPSQQALILESVAVNPEATTLEKAEALKDLVKAQELLASSFGLKEIYFLASDRTVLEIASKRGFEVLDMPVLRLKL